MGFKSEAQRRKFQDLLATGKITQGVFDAFNDDTPKGKKLPERVGATPNKKDGYAQNVKPKKAKR